MIKFIHSADIHLDSPLLKLEQYEGALADRLRNAVRRAFENLVDLALSEKVQFVLIAGDLYDGDWRDYNTGLFFVRQLARLKGSIPSFLIGRSFVGMNVLDRKSISCHVSPFETRLASRNRSIPFLSVPNSWSPL